MKRFAGFGRTIRKHPLGWSLLVGCLFIVGWTLLRFFTDKSIFDLVDQQLFARSIAGSMTPDTIFGPTSYILKVFLVYIPFEWLHLLPRVSLVIMTLLLNLAAYVLIVFAIRSILRELKVKLTVAFYIAIMWLAAMAGSIFWIEFANSRNIEVAAGLWVVALGLRYIARFEQKIGWLLLGIGTLTFYMDPLQVYMTALPLVVFSLLTSRSAGTRRRITVYLSFGVILIAAYILAALTTSMVETALGISVVAAGSAVAGAMAALGHISDTVRSLAVANVRLLGGVLKDGGRLHQIVALGGIVAVFVVWLWQAATKRLNSRLVLFVAVFVVVIEVVYCLSGQITGSDTSRYLIMLAPVCVIAIASLPIGRRLSKVALGAVIVVIVLSAGLLVGMISTSWSSRFSQDSNLTTIAQYVDAHPGVNFYASMDTALPAIYFNPGLKLRPVACDNGQIQKVTKGPYNVQMPSSEESAIVFDSGRQISNDPQICTDQSVEKQLGAPSAVQDIDHDHEVLFYSFDLEKTLK